MKRKVIAGALIAALPCLSFASDYKNVQIPFKLLKDGQYLTGSAILSVVVDGKLSGQNHSEDLRQNSYPVVQCKASGTGGTLKSEFVKTGLTVVAKQDSAGTITVMADYSELAPGYEEPDLSNLNLIKNCIPVALPNTVTHRGESTLTLKTSEKETRIDLGGGYSVDFNLRVVGV